MPGPPIPPVGGRPAVTNISLSQLSLPARRNLALKEARLSLLAKRLVNVNNLAGVQKLLNENEGECLLSSQFFVSLFHIYDACDVYMFSEGTKHLPTTLRSLVEYHVIPRYTPLYYVIPPPLQLTQTVKLRNVCQGRL